MTKPVNPIGSKGLQFRRSTNRYANKGSFSSNRGYLQVARDSASGKFIPRKCQQRLVEDATMELVFRIMSNHVDSTTVDKIFEELLDSQATGGIEEMIQVLEESDGYQVK